jgi:hypothetical protein
MIRSRLTRCAALALFGAAALVLTSCLPAPQGTPKQRTDAAGVACTVGIVGDSLSVGVDRFGDPTTKFRQRGCTLRQIDPKGGRTVGEGAAIVEHWAATGQLPEILIVLLGTNNCDYASMADGVRRILTAAGPDRPVVWQNTYRAGCDGPVNQALMDAQAAELRRPNGGRLWIVDHNTRVRNNPRLVSDGIHMGPDGYREGTTILADAVSTVIIK